MRLLLLTGREYAATQVSDDAIRFPVNPEGIKTLGALFHNVLTVEVVSERDRELIWQAIKVRNWLMHDYWSTKGNPRSAVLLLTPDGRRELIEELRGVWRRLRKATGLVHALIDQYLAAHGLSMQQFMERTAAVYLSDIEPPAPKDLIQ